ncbi:MAG: type VI secretion protein ImpB [Alphaproteobacteria bacterium]
MRKPETIERLYLDFDGFFASVEQQVRPRLRDRPIGVVPFTSTVYTCVIACSKEAKRHGVTNVMPVLEAKKLCPDIVLVPQSPDLYRRAHHALLNEIACVIPIDAIKSIDEITCRLEPCDRAAPRDLAARIQARIADNIGPYITCSIGFAANRLLAKMAGKRDKPNGVTIWNPVDMPAPLLEIPLADISGVGKRMERRLGAAGIFTMAALWKTQPKHLRKIWGNVTGERLWYALHGHDIQATPPSRGMFGHGRVLPPQWRDIDHARACSRLLLIKAARRMRRAGFYAGRLWLWMVMRDARWSGDHRLPIVHDDQACLAGLAALWEKAGAELPGAAKIIQLGITLLDLSPATSRQLDMLIDDDLARKRWERVTAAVDRLNMKYSKTVVSMGPWTPPPGGYAGGKISYTRIPRAEDFW